MSERTSDVDALFGVASGRIRHVYAGSCPDDVEGWDSRDPECPACQVLLHHTASRTVQPSVPEYPSPDDLLGADPEWTGGVSVDEYMNRARRRPEGER